MVDYIYGFSNRADGDMSNGLVRSRFAMRIGFKDSMIVLMEQIHGSKIAHIRSGQVGKVAGADGLVYKRETGDSGILLCVLVADCVPILARDPDKLVIGIAHGGWRGTISGICGNLVEQMVNVGASVGNIQVEIGAHIGGCCYNVPEGRAKLFQDRYKDDLVTYKYDSFDYVDLARANYLDLIKKDVLPEKIHAPATCTSCQKGKYFSFRVAGGVQLQRQIGYIGFKT